MRCVVNGEPRELPEPTHVSDVVAELSATQHGVAVALDGDVVPRSAWSTTRLTDGAQVEVLTAVQGG
jgi:sulfur carrier protein